LRVLLLRLILVSLTLAGLVLSQENSKEGKPESGYARVQALDKEGNKITLAIDLKEKLTLPVGDATLKTVKGENANLSDFKEGQFVKYSWDRKDGTRTNIRLAQTFCKTNGPTQCETESNNKQCHHNCKDGPCACPR
jgi:Cu/Ag efflux protein CusF